MFSQCHGYDDDDDDNDEVIIIIIIIIIIQLYQVDWPIKVKRQVFARRIHETTTATPPPPPSLYLHHVVSLYLARAL